MPYYPASQLLYLNNHCSSRIRVASPKGLAHDNEVTPKPHTLQSQDLILRIPHNPQYILVKVEIKLRLKDEAAHQQVAQALQPQLTASHKQENIFFDGSKRELSKERIVVRTRFYNVDQRCLLTVKVCLDWLRPISLMLQSSKLFAL